MQNTSLGLVFQYFVTAGAGIGAGLAVAIIPAVMLFRWITNRAAIKNNRRV